MSTLTTQMKDFLLDAAEKFRIKAGAERLAKVRTRILMKTSPRRGLRAPVCSRDLRPLT